ncbi:hypothetical protein K469DRAFT_393469 [Zopfia rhizophila CBS 207.26]|uniref:Uncharacterized protein n=1 Tax=Zopfia rhizophila CBS 207.26 TaxID=1314779 RepID=A0A6A6ELQ0_9PEZI|nr:hypothetical protein K469DRAFT_393469 [Zopfia rhizophila CBS 207.26]
MTSMGRCASSSFTFANMNTETDMSTLSRIQVLYCDEHGFSPSGMAMLTVVPASTTSSGGVRTPGGCARLTAGGSVTASFSRPTSSSGRFACSFSNFQVLSYIYP